MGFTGLSLVCCVLCIDVRILLGSSNDSHRILTVYLRFGSAAYLYPYLVGTDVGDALEPLRTRYNQQHYNLRKFYYECSNLKYLTGLINVPKLGQEPPSLTDSGSAPDLPKRPKSAAAAASPPPTAPSPDPTAAQIAEQARMLKEYEDQQAALIASRQAEETRRLEQQMAQQREFEEAQRQQAERERLAQEELLRQQQTAQIQLNNQAAVQLQEMERQMLALRSQWERDQLMLEQYDRVGISVCDCCALLMLL